MLGRWLRRQNPWAVMFGVPIRRKPNIVAKLNKREPRPPRMFR